VAPVKSGFLVICKPASKPRCKALVLVKFNVLPAMEFAIHRFAFHRWRKLTSQHLLTMVQTQSGWHKLHAHPERDRDGNASEGISGCLLVYVSLVHTQGDWDLCTNCSPHVRAGHGLARLSSLACTNTVAVMCRCHVLAPISIALCLIPGDVLNDPAWVA